MEPLILTMSPSMGICKVCGHTDLDKNYFVEFRVEKNGNNGKIVCNNCSRTAWNVSDQKYFENIPGEVLDQIVTALKSLYA